MRLRPLVRVAAYAVGGTLALELTYVAGMNLVLRDGYIERAASNPPENVHLEVDRAFSPWPGRVYLHGLHMRLQDGVQQFGLTVDRATVDVVLWDLLHREFHASRVQAEGVSYRQVVKVDTAVGQEERLAAFPPIEGFSRPALLPKVPSPPQTPADIAALWRVELDRVDATFNELWFLEYRYRGAGRIHGAFAFAPVQSLWVGPALVQFDGGELSAGEHRVAPVFTARLDLTLAPLDIPSAPGLLVFHTLTGSIRFDTALPDLDVASLYVDGLRAQGTAQLTADLEIVDGRLAPRSSFSLWLPGAEVRIAGYDFTGDAQAELGVSGNPGTPAIRATLGGQLRAPFDGDSVEVALADVTGEVAFKDDDLSRGLKLQWLRVTSGSVRVQDARPLTHKVAGIVPVVAKWVLGKGPLVASATAYATPAYALVRLKDAKLGGAEIEGAALEGAGGWSGAAAGNFGGVRIGLRLHDDKLQGVPFASSSWLGDELAKAGILPDTTVGVPSARR